MYKQIQMCVRKTEQVDVELKSSYNPIHLTVLVRRLVFKEIVIEFSPMKYVFISKILACCVNSSIFRH